MQKLKNDKYRKSRGGHSRVLDVKCAKCNSHLFYYQKDGPGILKRTYLDRILPKAPAGKILDCARCGEMLGVAVIYKKENRPAFRLFEGAVIKKVTSLDTIK